MSKWVIKIDLRSSSDWITAGSAYLVSKAKALEIIDALGPDKFELVEFEGTDTLNYYSSYNIPKDDFWVIRSIDNPEVNFYLLRFNSDICFCTWNFDTNKYVMTTAYASRAVYSYLYIRKASDDTIMFHSQNNGNGGIIITTGIDQDGNVKRYALGNTSSSTLYYYCYDTKLYNSCGIVAGRYDPLYADFLGLQKITIPEWGIIFDEAFFVTHAPFYFSNLIEMDGVHYATSAGYASGTSLFQMAIKFPD